MNPSKNPSQLPKLWYKDLDSPRRSGMNQVVCRCPVCGTRHLYVNRISGLFKCFYAGCPFKGITEEKKAAYRKEHQVLHRQPVYHHRKEDGCDYLSGIEDD